MIIDIDIGKKSFYVTCVVIYLILNWLSMILLGIMHTRKSETFDLWDSFTGFLLTVVTLAWWFAE